MSRISKRQKVINGKLTEGKVYTADEAFEFLKSLPKLKFDESVDVSVNLGVDPSKSDQTVRGAVVLPNGSGRKVRVAVFAQGDAADKAKAAGADIVGFDDLAAAIKAGEINFDILIATPDAMRVIGALGQILGPRGLMPNPKVGTVTPDVATAVKNAKGGQVAFRADKNGIVHTILGKLSFETKALHENLVALINELVKIKPASAKGIYLKKISISSTMGPGLVVDQSSL